jgi:hypothetical protein
MLTVLDEVTWVVGDTRSAAGKVIEASETVEAPPRAFSVALQVSWPGCRLTSRRTNPSLP